MNHEKMLARRGVLLAQQGRLAAQIELLDELLGEAADALPPAGAVPVARAPKADRSGPRSAGKEATAERLADALLTEDRSASRLTEHLGNAYATTLQTLKSHPRWFESHGQGRMTKWRLTQEGRQAAQARREG